MTPVGLDDQVTIAQKNSNAVLTEVVMSIWTDAAFADQAQSATPTELAALIQKMKVTYPPGLPAVEAIGARGESVMLALEQALVAVATEEPSFDLTLGYCRACQVAGKAPSEALDGVFAAFVDHYRRPYPTKAYAQAMARARELLAVIPESRLVAMMFACSNVPWLLVGAAPTAEICQWVARTLAEMDDDDERYEDYHHIAMTSLGHAVVPALCEALAGEVGPKRVAMIGALATIGDDRAAQVLVAQLNQKAKRPREAAKASLLALTPDAVFVHLEEALGSRRKDVRQAAAEVLRAFAPTPRGFELAQSFLAKEKVAGIKEILEGVQAPTQAEAASVAHDPVQSAEIVAALKASSGAAWKEYIEVGDALVEIFVAYLAEVHLGSFVRNHSANLVDMMAHFATSPPARRTFIDVIGAFFERDAPVLLNEVVKHIPDLPTDLGQAFIERRIGPPAAFSKWPDNFGDDAALTWIFEEHPQQGWDAAVAGLRHDRKTVRALCVTFMLGAPERIDAEAHVVPLLSSRAKDLRLTGAELLGHFAGPEHLPLIEGALEKEKVAGVRAAMENTIVRLHTRGLDIDSYARDADGDSRLAARLGELAASALPGKVASALAELGPVRWRTGAALDPGALQWFLRETLAESAVQEGEKVRQVRARLIDEDCHALCDQLIAVAGNDDLDWPLFMQAILASPAQIESIGRRLEDYRSSHAHRWGDYAIEMLVRTGSFQAARIMDDWAHHTRHGAFRYRVYAGVQRLAARRQISADELLDATLSTYDWDPTAKETAIKKTRANLVRHLQDAMIMARRWAPATWHERFAQYDLTRDLVTGLVWGVYDLASDTLQRTFRLDDAAELFDLELGPITFNDGEYIGIAHPLELGADCTLWLDHLTDAEQTQPFQQLDRPAFAKTANDDVQAHLLTLGEVAPKTFLKRLNQLGYKLSERDDAGCYFVSRREVGAWSLILGHTGFAPDNLDATSGVHVSNIALRHHINLVELPDAPRFVYSEVLHDIYALMQAP